MDGNLLLRAVLDQSTYRSAAGAVAALTLFSHPATVQQTGNRNLFRVVRRKTQSDMGKVHDAGDGLSAMWDDNAAPTHAFRWANGLSSAGCKDVQFNHVYDRVPGNDVCAGYTALANLCVTPAFLAKLTDTDPEIRALLRYRVFELYGYAPADPPPRPDGYSSLEWRDLLTPVPNLQETLRLALYRSRKSRTAHSVREIGWLFSEFTPDTSISQPPPATRDARHGSHTDGSLGQYAPEPPRPAVDGEDQSPPASGHHLIERVEALPTNASAWTGNATKGVGHHALVSLSKDPFHLRLLWTSADGERVAEVGLYRIHLDALADAGIVQRKPGRKVLLRFVRRSNGTIGIQANNASPWLPVGFGPA